MLRNRSPFPLPRRLRWVVKPVLAVGAGGSALALATEEVALAPGQCLPIAAISGMAGIIYWFNYRVFAARRPDSIDRGEK